MDEFAPCARFYTGPNPETYKYIMDYSDTWFDGERKNSILLFPSSVRLWVCMQAWKRIRGRWKRLLVLFLHPEIRLQVHLFLCTNKKVKRGCCGSFKVRTSKWWQPKHNCSNFGVKSPVWTWPNGYWVCLSRFPPSHSLINQEFLSLLFYSSLIENFSIN